MVSSFSPSAEAHRLVIHHRLNLSIRPVEHTASSRRFADCSAGVVHPTHQVCCNATCGLCGGHGCSSRPGGPRQCCMPAILRTGRVCESQADVACSLRGSSNPFNSIRARTRGSRSPLTTSEQASLPPTAVEVPASLLGSNSANGGSCAAGRVCAGSLQRNTHARLADIENNLRAERGRSNPSSATSADAAPELGLRASSLVAPYDAEYRRSIWWSQRDALSQGAEHLRCRQTLCEGELPTKLVDLVVGGVVPRHGGIGACVQLALRAYVNALSNSSGAVDLHGGFKWYTGHQGCAGASPPYACYTQPLVGVRNCTVQHDRTCAAATSCNKMCWWGVVHAYAFRPTVRLLAAERSARAQWRWWDRPHIALHLRRGDKLTDSKSKQQGSNVSVAAYADAVLQLAMERRRVCGEDAPPADVFIASDSRAAVVEIVELLSAHRSLLVVHTRSDGQPTETQRISDGKPVEIGYAGASLAPALQSSLADEAFLDIHMLSQAPALVGLCMSQVARVALLVGGAGGTLRDAVAMDSQNINRVDPWKFGRAEGWRPTGPSARARETWQGMCGGSSGDSGSSSDGSDGNVVQETSLNTILTAKRMRLRALRPPPPPSSPPLPNLAVPSEWLHVFTTACGKMQDVFSWVTRLASSIHAGLRTHGPDLPDKGIHLHFIHDNSTYARDVLELMRRAALAGLFKPSFRFSAEPPEQTTFTTPHELRKKTGKRPCGLSRIFVGEWFPQLDHGIYIDADCLMLGDLREVFDQHLSRFSPTQWIGMAWESERGKNYFKMRSKSIFQPQGLNSGVMLVNLTRMRTKPLVQFARDFKLPTSSGDQDILNYWLQHHRDEIYRLPCELNRRDYRFNHYEPDHMYDSKCDAPLWAEPGVLHGNGHGFDDDDINAPSSRKNQSDPQSLVRAIPLATAFYRLRGYQPRAVEVRRLQVAAALAEAQRDALIANLTNTTIPRRGWKGRRLQAV